MLGKGTFERYLFLITFRFGKVLQEFERLQLIDIISIATSVATPK